MAGQMPAVVASGGWGRRRLAPRTATILLRPPRLKVKIWVRRSGASEPPVCKVAPLTRLLQLSGNLNPQLSLTLRQTEMKSAAIALALFGAGANGLRISPSMVTFNRPSKVAIPVDSSRKAIFKPKPSTALSGIYEVQFTPSTTKHKSLSCTPLLSCCCAECRKERP